jgi:hypothetical protein
MFRNGIKSALTFLLAVLICGSAEVFAQHQGIGLRLGEPFGITYKRYLPQNRALEFLVGSAPKQWGEDYYRNSFEDRYEDDDEVSHDVKSVVYLQGRYLFHNPIAADIEGKFTWYWGVGALIKSARVEYRYREEIRTTNQVIYERDRTDIDFGPEVIGGVEYTFEDAPISVFGEFDLLLELTDRTTFRLLGGVGARFNF